MTITAPCFHGTYRTVNWANIGINVAYWGSVAAKVIPAAIEAITELAQNPSAAPAVVFTRGVLATFKLTFIFILGAAAWAFSAVIELLEIHKQNGFLTLLETEDSKELLGKLKDLEKGCRLESFLGAAFIKKHSLKDRIEREDPRVITLLPVLKEQARKKRLYHLVSLTSSLVGITACALACIACPPLATIVVSGIAYALLTGAVVYNWGVVSNPNENPSWKRFLLPPFIAAFLERHFDRSKVAPLDLPLQTFTNAAVVA